MERFMRFWKFPALLLATTLSFPATSSATQADRIPGPIDSSQMVALTGNVHGLAQPRYDLGRADGGKVLHGVALAFRPSAAQQQDLNNLLAQQQDRSSPNYHKWLTPAQFADRFGMTRDDIGRIQAWLESQGLTVTSVANSRNQISFDGTVAQIEAVFHTEIHDYLVDGAIHFANATNPSVPAALAGSVVAISHLHDFSPKPRVKFSRKSAGGADPHFTSYVSGNHFLAPGDFATIYDLPAGLDGTGQSIAIIGQSTVSAADLSNFRSAAGLPAKVPQYILYPSNSTATRCSGDEGESDLDLEWSGGVATNANIIFVYAGLVGGDTCEARNNSVWDALQQAVDNNYAPVISTSYGYCESGLGSGFVDEVEGWAQEANTQGQTIMAASGDAGAADCDGTDAASATGGLAVDVPAAIPEVTGMGGTEFSADSPTYTTDNPPGGDPPYWAAAGATSDTLSSALEYIGETGWNDTVENDGLLASGGGASIYFTKPTWQTGTGVPSDGKRDVPDLALNASPYHDPYLICSEDGEDGTIVATCTSGFRTGAGGDLTPVGGTSCAAPTFAGIVALLNESLGASGLGNINPTLYTLAASNPTAFHDVTTGNNIVPCTSGTPNCPNGTKQYGFSAGTGYDQVTGLGSVDASVLFLAWAGQATAPDFTLTAGAASPTSIPAGQSANVTLTITPVNSSHQTISFSCSGLPAGTSCTFNPLSVGPLDGTDSQTTTLTISSAANMVIPTGLQTITVTGTASGTGGESHTANVNLTVTATNQSFTLTTTAATFIVPAVGGSVPVTITVANPGGGGGSPIPFVGSTTALPLTYSCSGSPSLSTAEISCQWSPGNGQPTSATSVTVTFVTTAKTTQLVPLGGRRVFYALLLPGLFGVFFLAGPRTRGIRLLSLIVVLGCSTLWLGACGGGGSSSTPPNSGTPTGTYAVTITATTGAPTGGTALTFTLPLTLNVQ